MDRKSKKHSHGVPDLILGCSETQSSSLSGRLMILFLDENGEIIGQRVIPAESDLATDSGKHDVGLRLQPYDQFGQSLAPYIDLDQNGIKEFFVGAPGTDYLDTVNNITMTNAGAIYLLFLRRRLYHPGQFDWFGFYLKITIPLFFFCFSCVSGITYFCWRFRRQPDEIEIMVKQSGLSIDAKKKRDRYKKKHDKAVYCDEYVV